MLPRRTQLGLLRYVMFSGIFVCQGKECRFLRHHPSQRLYRLTDFHETWHKIGETKCLVHLFLNRNNMADAVICEFRETLVPLDWVCGRHTNCVKEFTSECRITTWRACEDLLQLTAMNQPHL